MLEEGSIGLLSVTGILVSKITVSEMGQIQRSS